MPVWLYAVAVSSVKRRRGPGRTPSVDASQIAEAVRCVGLREGLTMNAVAEELGVDVTTLYRHVGGVDALRQLGARLTAPTVDEWPEAEGKTWQEWLSALARYYRRELRKNPDLVEFAQTALDPDFRRLEHAVRILVDLGFAARPASFAHGFLMTTVVGYVQQELREHELTAQGNSLQARFIRALEVDSDGEQLVRLREIGLSLADFDSDVAFERFLAYAIDGIAAHPGAPRPRQARSK